VLPGGFAFIASAICGRLDEDQMKTVFDYPVVCRRDDNGSYVAYVPALEGCHALGRTPEEAQEELHNCTGAK